MMRFLPLAAILGYALVAIVSVRSCVTGEGAREAPLVSAPPVSLEEKRARRVAAMAASWPAAPSYAVSFDALRGEKTVHGGNASHAVYDPADAFGGLPREGAYEFVAMYCSACHTLEIVMQQRATKARWIYMIDWMTKEQNMPPLPDGEKAEVLDYLSDHFGPTL